MTLILPQNTAFMREKKCGMYYTMECYSVVKKRWDPAIYYNVDGPWEIMPVK